jgi:hypothetical protein
MNDPERLLLLQKELCERELDLLVYFEGPDSERMVGTITDTTDVARPHGISADQDKL